MKKTSIFLLLIFLILLVALFFYWQSNRYSKDILKIEIIAPEKVEAGERFEYTLRLKNNGQVRLEKPELIFQAPEECILEDHQELRITKEIEDIYPGEERTYSFIARLFAPREKTLKAEASLSYNPKNLQSRYESKTSFTSQISFVPITFEFDLPSRAEEKGTLSFSINYFSNIEYLLENLRVRIQYPQNFNFLSSSPEALDQSEWMLPSLYQASGGKIEIRGNLEGSQGQEKVFRASLGFIKDGKFLTLKETSQSVKITESSLYLSCLINNSQKYTASAGEMLHYNIFFKNIGKSPIQKKFLFAKLEGDLFDLSTLKSIKGEFGQGDNTILWDWKNVSDLRFLDTKNEGEVEFWVELKEDIDYKVKGPKLRVIVSSGGVEEVFETKVNSKIDFKQEAYFEQEFFLNSGPLPPQIGEETEYVILWRLEDSWNDLNNVKIRADLPENVKPTGKFFPEDTSFTYDSKSGEVMWNIGEVKADQIKEKPLALAFQIKFEPDSSQFGKTPLLIKEAYLECEDVWTSKVLEKEVGGVDTTLPDDKTVGNSEGIVK